MAVRELVELASRVAELERRFSGAMRHGTVEEADAARQRVRLNFGSDVEGKPFLSPWVPYAQIAGALKVHTPPSRGQQFTLISPCGDWQQAVALPMTWSDQNQPPSSRGDENVLAYGNVKATIRDDLTQVHVGGTAFEITSGRVLIKVGGVAVEITGGGVTITGGKVMHDGRNIGASHIHGGVEPGDGLTGIPAN